LKVTGFDVAVERTGSATLEQGKLVGWSVIVVRAGIPRDQQLFSILQAARLEIVQMGPDLVVVETSVKFQGIMGDSRESVEGLAMARAAILLACRLEGVRVVQYGVNAVREKLCRRATAGKEQAQECLRQLGYTLPEWTHRVKQGGNREVRLTRRGARTVSVGGHFIEVTTTDPDVADALALAWACWQDERFKRLVEEQGHA